MARKPIEIPIGVDAGAFEKGVSSGIIEPLGDAKDALRDLAEGQGPEQLEEQMRAAQKQTVKLKDETRDTADAIERRFKGAYREMKGSAKDASDEASRGMRDAQKDTAKLADETRDTGDAIERSFRVAYRQAKESSDDATGKMRKGMRDVGEEASQSAREGAASFTGEFDDVGDFFQEVAANAFAGFGPAGAAAGLAAAVGLGFAVAKIEELKDKVEDLQQAANDVHMAALDKDETVEQFSTSVDGATAALQRLSDQGQKDFRWFWEEDSTGLQEFNDDLRRVGETQADALDVFQLTTEQMGDYRDAVRRNVQQLRDQAAAISDAEKGMGTLTDADLNRISALKKQADAGERIIATLENEMETRSEAAERSDAWAESGAAAATRQAEAEKTAAEDRAAAQEAAADRITAATEAVRESALGAYDSMRDMAYEKATADDQAFDVDKWLTYVEETRAQADAYRANLQSMQLTPEEMQNLLALPEEARAGIAASYAAAGDESKARIRAALGDGGGADAGAQATQSFVDAFNPEANVDVTTTTDTSESEARVATLTKPRELPVTVKLDTSELARFRPQQIEVPVVLVVDSSPLSRAIDRQNGRTVTVNVEGRKVGDAWQ